MGVGFEGPVKKTKFIIAGKRSQKLTSQVFLYALATDLRAIADELFFNIVYQYTEVLPVLSRSMENTEAVIVNKNILEVLNIDAKDIDELYDKEVDIKLIWDTISDDEQYIRHLGLVALTFPFKRLYQENISSFFNRIKALGNQVGSESTRDYDITGIVNEETLIFIADYIYKNNNDNSKLRIGIANYFIHGSERDYYYRGLRYYAGILKYTDMQYIAFIIMYIVNNNKGTEIVLNDVFGPEQGLYMKLLSYIQCKPAKVPYYRIYEPEGTDIPNSKAIPCLTYFGSYLNKIYSGGTSKYNYKPLSSVTQQNNVEALVAKYYPHAGVTDASSIVENATKVCATGRMV